MDGELVCGIPDYTLPPLEDIVNAVRADDRAVLRSGVKSNDFDLTDISDDFRSMPISEAMQSRFILAHFDLNERFGGSGQIFEGLEDRWVEPWRRALAAHGFTFSRVFSILFAAGPHSSTNYHMDYTQQLAWQRYGTKRWGGLLEPDRWTTMEQRTNVRLEGMCKPARISESDVYTITQHPNTVPTPANVSERVQRRTSLINADVRQTFMLQIFNGTGTVEPNDNPSLGRNVRRARTHTHARALGLAP